VQAVLAGFGTIVAVIALGYLIESIGLLGDSAGLVLTRLAFFVATPCLLLTVMADSQMTHVLSRSLIATVAGTLAAGLPYALVARLLWRRRPDEVAIGTMCSAYCNAGNLGLPVAAYVLGDASLIVPMLLLQLVILQPTALAVLDAGRTGDASLAAAIRSPLTNPLTLATLLGLVISIAGWTLPAYVRDPIDLVGAMAVPGVLIAYGMSLRRGPLPGRGTPPGEIALVATLKLIVQPIGAYIAGRALGLAGPALIALAVTAALPSAQNIFVHATRFGRQQVLARDAIFVTTLGSVPAIGIIVVLLT
jgi:malonate transporter and related proteins